MTLIKRNEDLFPSLWNGFFETDWLGLPNVMRADTSVPAVNLKESQNSFDIEMAAPGMKKEDFKIDLDNNVLTISSEMKSENTEKDSDGRYTRREFNYQSFRRAFTLPDTTAHEKIGASYKDGVLHVSIPKKEEALPKPVKTIKIS